MKINLLPSIPQFLPGICLALSLLLSLNPSPAWSQSSYNGIGNFELITNPSELEPGYYVITNENSEFALTNGRSGSATTGYYLPATINLSNGVIANPSIDQVWKIDSSEAGWTIYNEETAVYIGWLSGNAASADSFVTDNARWVFSYTTDKWTVNNLSTPLRQLSYNAGNPRFAAYGNALQQELQLYKLMISPALSSNPNALTGLDYIIGSGPSLPQTLTVSGLNLNGTDVIISLPGNADFEIAGSMAGSFGPQVTFASYDGTSTSIYARLKAGLAVASYADTLIVSGGGANTLNVSLSGSVNVIPVIPEITPDTIFAQVGQFVNHSLSATHNPASFDLSGAIPLGMAFDSVLGIFNGTPSEGGVFTPSVTATNIAGTSAAVTIVIDVAPGVQTLSLADLNLAVGAADVSLPEQTDQGVGVLYASSNSSVGSISGNILSPLAIGQASIYVQAAATADYMAFADTFMLSVVVPAWEDFEADTKNSYAAGSISGNAGNWILSDALLGTSAGDLKSGTQSVRMRGLGFIENEFDIAGGLGTVTIYHGYYGNDGPQDWILKISDDGGSSWTAFESEVITSGPTLEPAIIAVNLAADVRMRIETLSTSSSQRINIDDINITPFPSGPTINLSSLSPDTVCTETASSIEVTFNSAGIIGTPSYTVELSNALGDFTNPIASTTGTTSPINLPIADDLLTEGIYQIRLVSGATVSDSMNLVVLAGPSAGSITALNGTNNSDVICAGEVAQVLFTATGGTAPYTLTFSDGSTNQIEVINVAASDLVILNTDQELTATYELIKLEDTFGCILE